MKTYFQSTFSVISVAKSSKSSAGKRIFDRSDVCFFCGKKDKKIWRHYRKHHDAEDEVEKILALKNEKVKKKNAIALLRHRGNFFHNIKVFKTGGELLVWRRPSQDSQGRPEEYAPCVHCFAFVTSKQMWKHIKACPENKDGRSAADSLRESRTLLYSSSFPAGASEDLKLGILDRMQKDEVGVLACTDSMITTYASSELGDHGLRKKSGISNSMRLLARLVIGLRKRLSLPSATLVDVLKPGYFNAVVEEARVMGGFKMVTAAGEQISNFEIPSTPLKLGYALEGSCQAVRGASFKAGDEEVVKDVEKFIKLYDWEWSKRVSSIAVRSQKDVRFDKVQLLPITEDMNKVRVFLEEEIKKQMALLETSVDKLSVRRMLELTGIKLTILNRRRISEVFGMLVSDFVNRGKWKAAEIPEIMDSFTALEKQLLNR